MAQKKVRQRMPQAEEKTVTEEKVHNAMRRAFVKSGISGEQDIERLFGEAQQALLSLNSLQERQKAIIDAGEIAKIRDGLIARSEEDGRTVFNMARVMHEIEKFPNFQESIFADQYNKAKELYDGILKHNPFALEVFKRLSKEDLERRKEERSKQFQDEVKLLRQGTVSLHEAITMESDVNFVAARVEVPDTRRGISEVEKRPPRVGWIRLEVRRRGVGEVVARVVGATKAVWFLTSYSLDRDSGREVWVVLNPPDFRTPRGEPYFHAAVREALRSLYQYEEERLAEQARITATPADILAGKDGFTILRFKRWQDSGRSGPIKLELEAQGEKVKVVRVESQAHNWQDLLDREFDRTSLDPRLRRLLQAAKHQKAIKDDTD